MFSTRKVTRNIRSFRLWRSCKSFLASEALYYGLNALSNNLIMVDRKRLKNPNGLAVGGEVAGNEVHVVSGPDCLFLLLDLGAVQIGDLPLDRLDGVHLVHGLDVQSAEPMNGKERLHLMHGVFHMDGQTPFRFSWDWLAPKLSVRGWMGMLPANPPLPAARLRKDS